MCDMQKMLSKEDASCDEDSEMNFAAFSTAGTTGTHFVTTSGQVPVAKVQQGVPNNAGLQQVVGMVGGVGMGEGLQYLRTLDDSGALQTPQFISLPIALPGAKPGDPQQTVQIQVLSPNLTLQPQQQAKYQMQIPIQSFQQGGAVLTVAYSQDANETGGIQLLGNTLPEGIQVLTAMPQEMQLIQQAPESKEHIQQAIQQQQVFIAPNNHIIINGEQKPNVDAENNNAISNVTNIIIKEECEDNNDDESSQGTEPDVGDGVSWQLANSQQELIKYLNTLPPQQVQSLPVSLQQFLRLNPADSKKGIELIEVQVQDEQPPPAPAAAEAVLTEDGLLKITQCKKKKKYKKKPPKPARPKPGQVVIATDSDGAPIFCCPECQMAYPEKEHLEMHLAVHKIERRFICGICGAGLKRKEHLERHKLGHNPERPYVCGVCCKGFKRREHLNLHTVIHSGVKTELCLECGKGFYRKDHLRKHTRSHESRRAREEAQSEEKPGIINRASATNNPSPVPNPNPVANVMPEITIHVPTSGHMGVPVQINIPQHMVSSLQPSNDPLHLDTILGDHT